MNKIQLTSGWPLVPDSPGIFLGKSFLSIFHFSITRFKHFLPIYLFPDWKKFFSILIKRVLDKLEKVLDNPGKVLDYVFTVATLNIVVTQTSYTLSFWFRWYLQFIEHSGIFFILSRCLCLVSMFTIVFSSIFYDIGWLK